jgi:hypothetical protein
VGTTRVVLRTGEELVEPHAREPAVVEHREQAWQGTYRSRFEIVMLGGIMEQDDGAVGERLANAFQDGRGALTGDAVVAARRAPGTVVRLV